jgi:hypothetical protein
MVRIFGHHPGVPPTRAILILSRARASPGAPGRPPGGSEYVAKHKACDPWWHWRLGASATRGRRPCDSEPPGGLPGAPGEAPNTAYSVLSEQKNREGLGQPLGEKLRERFRGPGGGRGAYRHYAEIVGALRAPNFSVGNGTSGFSHDFGGFWDRGPRNRGCAGLDPALSGSGAGLVQALCRNF